METHRKTRRRFEHPQDVRFLTFSCYQRLPLFLNDEVKLRFVQQLSGVCERLEVALHAWVIMLEHVHLLVTPNLPKVTIPVFLRALKQPVARDVLGRWRELKAPILAKVLNTKGAAHFWQAGGGYDRNIYSEKEYFEKLEYIHGNAVARGLVTSPCDWIWSSARWYAGYDDALIDLSRLGVG